MTIDHHTVLILAIIIFSTLIGSTFGFGLGLISMPLLAFVTDIKTATPLVAMVATTAVMGILLEHWREVQLKSARRLIIASLGGIPIGLFLLKGTQDEVMKIILAVIILCFSLYRLFGRTSLSIKTEKASYLFGFLAGILGGAYNMSGPPVIIYGSMRNWHPGSFRATLQGFFLPSCVFVMIGHFSTGFWTTPVLRLYVLCFPFVVLSILIGGRLNRSIPVGRFDRFVYILLVFTGTLLLVQSI